MNMIPLMEQREIEAQLAAALIESYANELGRTKAIALARKSIQSLAEKAGRQMATKMGGHSLTELARVVREVWAREDALEISFLNVTPNVLAFDVHRCRYAELYERLGIRDLGVHLSCCRDGAFARGFNPALRMERTRTIMEGAATCDFRFFLPESD